MELEEGQNKMLDQLVQHVKNKPILKIEKILKPSLHETMKRNRNKHFETLFNPNFSLI